MPETITFTAYHFAELNEAAKKKALEHFRDINTDYDQWADFILEDWKEEKLPALGYNDAKIFYSGFSSQGDGASFSAHVDILKWIEVHKYKTTRYAALYKFVKKTGSQITATICISRHGHYCHEMTMSAAVDGHLYNDVPDPVTKQGDEIAEEITARARAVARSIYQTLESEYFAMIKDEAVQDAIEANEYLFTENGKFVPQAQGV